MNGDGERKKNGTVKRLIVYLPLAIAILTAVCLYGQTMATVREHERRINECEVGEMNRQRYERAREKNIEARLSQIETDVRWIRERLEKGSCYYGY